MTVMPADCEPTGRHMTPEEYGRHLAASVEITDAQALEFARILLSNDERAAA